MKFWAIRGLETAEWRVQGRLTATLANELEAVAGGAGSSTATRSHCPPIKLTVWVVVIDAKQGVPPEMEAKFI